MSPRPQFEDLEYRSPLHAGEASMPMWFACVARWFTCTSSNFADPIDIAAIDAVGDPVQRVADDS
jgi:hypothetical protein